MQRINFTDFKKLTKEEIVKQIPIEIMFNGDAIFRVVPKTWRDPRFISQMAYEQAKLEIK